MGWNWLKLVNWRRPTKKTGPQCGACKERVYGELKNFLGQEYGELKIYAAMYPLPTLPKDPK